MVGKVYDILGFIGDWVTIKTKLYRQTDNKILCVNDFWAYVKCTFILGNIAHNGEPKNYFLTD